MDDIKGATNIHLSHRHQGMRASARKRSTRKPCFICHRGLSSRFLPFSHCTHMGAKNKRAQERINTSLLTSLGKRYLRRYPIESIGRACLLTPTLLQSLPTPQRKKSCTRLTSDLNDCATLKVITLTLLPLSLPPLSLPPHFTSDQPILPTHKLH